MSDRLEQILRGNDPTIAPDPYVVQEFCDRAVLVTGAAGSVGSEIARQVLTLPIRKLVLFDRDENGLFELREELASHPTRQLMHFVVGDIRDAARVRRTFLDHVPEIVIHAAAYKHVSVMEENCSEAVLNNVVGSLTVARSAIDHHARRFVLISTDKALNPISVMGATKRIAELIIRDLSTRSAHTRFCSVRFGNVTGSRGSVIPTFAKQIEQDRPLTVTDERMTRYFMSAAQASHLVFQACALSEQGEIYVFDMGEPIKIIDLARKMIELSGKKLGIRVTGFRPGEKLHEELWTSESGATPTRFKGLLRLKDDEIPTGFSAGLSELRASAERADDASARAITMRWATPELAAAGH